MGHYRITDPEREAALDQAVAAYQAALTSAELTVARAEQAMIEAIRTARSAPGAITWRRIGEAFGITHQAVLSRWGSKTKTPSTRHTPALPSHRPNRTNGAHQ